MRLSLGVEKNKSKSHSEKSRCRDFEKLYKGEISKSGAPILPSKRARRIPEKIKILQEDLEDSGKY